MELGFRIPIVSGIVNSLNWIFGVQSPGFQIPQAKNFPDSGHWITFHGVENGFSNCKQQYFFGRRGIGVSAKKSVGVIDSHSSSLKFFWFPLY